MEYVEADIQLVCSANAAVTELGQFVSVVVEGQIQKRASFPDTCLGEGRSLFYPFEVENGVTIMFSISVCWKQPFITTATLEVSPPFPGKIMPCCHMLSIQLTKMQVWNWKCTIGSQDWLNLNKKFIGSEQWIWKKDLGNHLGDTAISSPSHSIQY